MERRDVVAVVGSAGGVEALIRLVEGLPEDFPGKLLVSLHMSSSAPSLLAQVLARSCVLPVRAARDGMRLSAGEVVVAVPDRHLLVADGRVELGHGARENNHRPSHDALLRSVALCYGPRAIGVILTGLLDDGAVGLKCLVRYGGTGVVQDLGEAQFPDMPRHALLAVPHARQIPLEGLAKELVAMVDLPSEQPPVIPEEQRQLDLAELESARGAPSRMADGSIPGEPSALACPDCHGVLHRINDEDVLRYRCRTGHAWTAQSLLVEQDVALEQALWTALRTLEERAEVSERLAERALQSGRAWSTAAYTERIEEWRRAAKRLRELLAETAPPRASSNAP